MPNNILVVDDERDVCDFFQDTLPEEGYRVLTALNGKDALALVRKERPDMVLLDIKMPGLDGIEVLERIKKIDESIAVVMITGYGDLKTAREAMRLGAFDYVTKPFSLDFIKAVLRDALSLKVKSR